jgi:hypothetical protein
MRAFEFTVKEAEKPKVGRALQHAEDLVIVDGAEGAMRALDSLAAMADNVGDVTIKWDGSPAMYFGRDETGSFILTDKSGFMAKGYDGKVKSAADLEKMLLNRGKEEPNDSRRAFAASMAGLWDKFESIVDSKFRGYVFGDLLFQSTPPKDNNGDYTFTPNTVTYHIPSDSDLGKRIAKTSAGIVIHQFTDLDGQEQPVKGAVNGINTDGPVLIVGPTTVTEAPSVDTKQLDSARAFVKANAAAIDALLDDAKLAANKMADFKAILYKFVNQQVKTRDLTNLDVRFETWMETSGVSAPKQAKIAELRQTQPRAFAAMFDALEMIMQIKDDIIDQLDATSPVKASIQGQRGGEGYVKGNIKLVPRTKFTAANIEKHA